MHARTPRPPKTWPCADRRRRACVGLLGLIFTLALSFGAGAILVAAPPASAAIPSCDSAGITLQSLVGPNFYIDAGSSPSFNSAYTGYSITNATGAAMTDTWVTLSNFTGGSLGLASTQPASMQIAGLSAGASTPLFWYLSASTQTTAAQGFTVTVSRHNPALTTAVSLCSGSGGFANGVVGSISANANKVTTITVNGGAPAIGSRFTVTETGDTGQIGQGITGDPSAFWMSPAVASSWPARAFRLVSTSLTISPNGTAAPVTYRDTLRLANLGSTARSYSASYTFQAVGFTTGSTPVQPTAEIASGTQIKYTGSYPASIPAISPPVNTMSVALAAAPTRLDAGGGAVTYTATISGTPGAALDGLVLTPPVGSTFVPGSAVYDTAAWADGVSSGNSLVFTGPFTITGTSATLTFQLSLPATDGDRMTTLLGTIGAATIDGAGDLTGARPAAVTVNVDTPPTAAAITQTVAEDTTTSISLAGAVSDADTTDVLSISAGAPTTSGTVSVSGLTVTYTPPPGYRGHDLIVYSVDDGRGGSATADIDLTVAALAPQTLTFPTPADLPVGGTESAAAVSSAGLPASYRSMTPATCTVGAVTGTVTALAAGSCTIVATQDGDGVYTAAASPVSRTFAIRPLPQTIDFPALSDATVGDGITASASATSGLPVAFGTDTPATCVVDAVSGRITTLGAGTCEVIVEQPGDTHYEAAASVTRSFAIARAAQTITFAAAPLDATATTMTGVSATSDSGLAVTFTSVTPTVCLVDGLTGTVTDLIGGDCTITADQPGDTGFAPAPTASITFAVARRTQTIDFPLPADIVRLATGRAIATSSSTLPVVYSSTTRTVCIIDPVTGVITALADGTCTIDADQAGDAAFTAAPTVARSLAVTTAVTTSAPALQSIHFPELADAVVGATPTAAATASSLLPVAYAAVTPTVCTVDTATGVITTLRPGTCTITADQLGDAAFAAAPAVSRSFAIVPMSQHITFAPVTTLLVAPAPYELAASSDAGAPVSFTATGPCTLTGHQLSISAAGSCLVTANAAATALADAAAPVIATITTVQVSVAALTTAPADGSQHTYALTVPGQTPGVLISAVTAPARGTATLAAGRIGYVQDARSRGDASFSYTAVDASGRTVSESVQVTIPDAAPVIHAVRTEQLAGSARNVRFVATDPNGDPVIITRIEGGQLDAVPSGLDVTVRADGSLSGDHIATVIATDGAGSSATTTLTDRISPRAVARATARIRSTGTTILWPATSTLGARYAVTSDGARLCITPLTHCHTDSLYGPARTITVTVLGRDRTTSARTTAHHSGGHPVLLRTVYFDESSYAITARTGARLAALSRRIKTDGFRTVDLDGYTNAHGSVAADLALSQQRTAAVAAILARTTGITSRQQWHGKNNPAASNNTEQGLAHNRRVEIWVS